MNTDSSKANLEIYVIDVYWWSTTGCVNAKILIKDMFSPFQFYVD